MVPAMDRDTKPCARWFPVGLMLVLGSVDLGCSRLEARRKAENPPMLGMQRTSRDIYANAHQSRPTTPGAEIEAAAPEVGSPAIVEGAEEVGLAIRPAAPEGPVVNLQPPVPVAAPGSTASTAASATRGVPNSSILLASAERSTRPMPPTITPDRLVAEARAALDRMTSYQVLMHRQERVNGDLQPEEDVVLAVRREPLAVRLSWPVGPHKGREVLYRTDAPGGLMHVNMADSALPLPRLSIAPDSPMVMKNSRHPVTEAGFASLVRGLEAPQGTAGGSALSYTGLETPAPLDHPHHCLVRTGPSGEVSRVYLDPKTSLPMLFAVDGPNGELIERYVFRDVVANPPELASADAFDPNARWGPPRGLLGRIAGGAESPADSTPR
jgi:hypothetical protein